MKKIEPFNEVWLDCYNNLKISLLRYKNKNNVIRGYNNNYRYERMPFSFEGSEEFFCISEEQQVMSYEEFAEQTYINPKSEQEFYEIVIDHLLNSNGFVLMRTDLYDWLEGNICWHKYHWDHYSLIVDYDEENKRFLVFDEKGGNYIKFFVPKEKLFKCVFYSDKFEILRLITLSDSSKIKIQTYEDIRKNANEIIQSIDVCMKKEFWNMEEYIFDGGHYKDLNGIYLQKIEGRQHANSMLMDWLAEKNKDSFISFPEYKRKFDCLAVEWSKIRMSLFLMYLKKNNRREKIKELNDKLKECLINERELWKNIIAS